MNKITRKALNKAEKIMILNIYKIVLDELLISDIGDKAAHITGLSKLSILQVMQEYKNCSLLNSPKEDKIA